MRRRVLKNTNSESPTLGSGRWNNLIPTRKVQHDLKREALLRAAVSSFNRKGFHQTSLDEIADRLGVTKAALYYYFPNKNAILVACFDRAMQVSSESLARGKEGGRNGREKLILTLRYYVETVIGEWSEALLLTEEHSLEEDDRKKLIVERDKHERQLRALVREGIIDGSIVTCDPKLAIFLTLGAINWVAKWFSNKGEWTHVQTAAAIAGMLDRMLATNPCASLPADVGCLETIPIRSHLDGRNDH